MFWSSVARASSLMPVQGTEIAKQVDQLYVFLLWASFVSCVLVIGGFIYFSFKYKRQSDNDKTAYITHNNVLEFTWSFIPFLIFMGVFGWGWWVYSNMRSAPKDALEVQVIGQKWDWAFLYKSGKSSPAELVVPVNTPIKLVMTSRDVIHSFFVPAFRIKQDVVPGRYTSLWFNAKKEGNFQVFCTEYCGDQHSAMLAKVRVVSSEQYSEWLQNDPYKGLSMLDIGQKVYSVRCIACHSTTDQKGVGPGFAGLFGKERKFEGGAVAVADENYIRESILNPNAKVLETYPAGVMPTFAGQLSEEEIMGAIEYVKSLTQ